MVRGANLEPVFSPAQCAVILHPNVTYTSLFDNFLWSCCVCACARLSAIPRLNLQRKIDSCPLHALFPQKLLCILFQRDWGRGPGDLIEKVFSCDVFQSRCKGQVDRTHRSPHCRTHHQPCWEHECVCHWFMAEQFSAAYTWLACVDRDFGLCLLEATAQCLSKQHVGKLGI